MSEDRTAALRKRRERERALNRLRAELLELVLEDTLGAWTAALPALGLSCLVQIQEALLAAAPRPQREEVGRG